MLQHADCKLRTCIHTTVQYGQAHACLPSQAQSTLQLQTLISYLLDSHAWVESEPWFYTRPRLIRCTKYSGNKMLAAISDIAYILFLFKYRWRVWCGIGSTSRDSLHHLIQPGLILLCMTSILHLPWCFELQIVILGAYDVLYAILRPAVQCTVFADAKQDSSLLIVTTAANQLPCCVPTYLPDSYHVLSSL